MQQPVICSFCGVENPAGQEVCGQCGTPLVSNVPEPPKIKCPHCGSQNVAGQQFCGTCGAKLVAVAQEVVTAPAKKVPAAPVQQVPAAPAQQLPAAPVQQVRAAPAQQLPAAPAQQLPAAPTKEMPAKAVSPVALRQKVEVKPTMGLAWGLWWRMLALTLLIGIIIYAIVAIVMVLGFNYQLPFGA